MTDHAVATRHLFDSYDPILQLKYSNNDKMQPTTDNNEDDSDMHVLPDICPICEEGVIGPDSNCTNEDCIGLY